jgi:RimJ/RimL family protein N-acetyltransferase
MEGKLVRLRAIERSDIDAIMQWVSDEEVTRFLGGEMLLGPMSRIAEEKWIEQAAAPSTATHLFVIEKLGDHRYLGSTDLHNINWVNRSAEVGIVIGDKPSWGKGYGTDAMRVLLRFAFDRLNLNRVSLRVFDYNPRAIASYEKCGFQREGVLRQDKYLAGEYHDTIVMGILASEYRARLSSTPSP